MGIQNLHTGLHAKARALYCPLSPLTSCEENKPNYWAHIKSLLKDQQLLALLSQIFQFQLVITSSST